MSALDTRHTSRDSMFMVADIAFEPASDTVQVRVRNLSSTGMMAQAKHAAQVGCRVRVALPNCEEVQGVVAWAEGERMGVAFDREIDPKSVRRQAQSGAEGTPSYARSPVSANKHSDPNRTFRPV